MFVLTNAVRVILPELTFSPNMVNDPDGLTPAGVLNATIRIEELL